MLEQEIIELAKTKKVIVFFDMDGVCAEYGRPGEDKLIRSNAPGYYFNKRPIQSMLETMERISKIENVEIRILSNCYFPEQKQDKIKWLKIHAPFIKLENITVITLNDETYTKETKDEIKGNYIKVLTEGVDAHVRLVEDDHGIIKKSNELLSKLLPCFRAEHISSLMR